MGDIGDVDGRLPSVIGGLHLDGVIEVASGVRIDRDDVAPAQILASLEILGGDLAAEMFRLHAHRRREFPRETVLVDHREHVDAGGSGGPQHLHDGSLGIHMAVLPAVEARHDLVADLRAAGGRDIEVAREAGVVRHHMMEILRLLKRADDRGPAALDDLDDPSLLPSVAAWAPMVAGLLDKTSHDAVSVEGGAEVVRRDEKILPALVVGQHVAGATRMDLKLTGEEIRRLREDEVITAYADDTTLALEGRQNLLQVRKSFPVELQPAGNGGQGQSLLPQHGENPPDQRGVRPGSLFVAAFAGGLRRSGFGR